MLYSSTIINKVALVTRGSKPLVILLYLRCQVGSGFGKGSRVGTENE